MLKNRNLNLLLAGQLISQIGDKFHMLAVAFLVLKLTGSPAKMGLVLFCSTFPAMLLGIVAGAVIDRYNRKTIIIGADIARGLIIALLCVLFSYGAASFPLLLAVQTLISICTAFFDPAVPAIIPRIVDAKNLTKANAQTQFIRGVSSVIGPVLGGVTVGMSGYLTVFAINAFSYLFSAVMEMFITLPAIVRAKTEKEAISGLGRLKIDVLDGCKYVLNRKNLLIILLMVSVIHFFVGFIESVIPVFSTSVDGDAAANMGAVQTSFGLGLVAMGIFIGYLKVEGREAGFLFGSVFLMGVLETVISGVHVSGIRNPMIFLMFFLMMGGAVLVAATCFRSIIQKETDDAMMGRVFGVVASVGNISIPFGILVSGTFLETYSQNLVLAACGALLMLTALVSNMKYPRTAASALTDA